MNPPSSPWIANTWVAIGATLAAFLLLFGLLQVCARLPGARPEITRKLLHGGSGLLTLTFPFLFRDVWPVFLLTGASATLIAAVKFVPSLRARFGGVANRVDRETLGELYFPIAVAVLFWLTRDEHPLLFVIPVLMLTLADATCALVGGRYGLTRYTGGSKSLEGSVAFIVVAFFCVHVPLLLWTDIGRVESLLIASTLALLVMLLEGCAWRGLDNLFIPIGGYFLLRAYVAMEAPALLARLMVTAGLVVLIVLSRRRTTLEDDSLVAAAFLAYVAWAIMGWRWLVGPLAIFIGYVSLSPRTPDNSRRMHGVPAVLSIWAAAVVWLAVARSADRPALLFPYTIVFAAHLAMFGVSRLAFQFPDRPVAALFWRAVLTSAAVVLLPFIFAAGASPSNAFAVAIGILAIALGAAIFVFTQPHIRNLPQDAQRWILQAGAAALASLAAWIGTTALFGPVP